MTVLLRIIRCVVFVQQSDINAQTLKIDLQLRLP